MHLTTKGKYAVVALLDLALNESRFCFVSLSEVAKRQSIPAHTWSSFSEIYEKQKY